MREKIVYIITVILSIAVGIVGTIVVFHYFPPTSNQTQAVLKKDVTITETNTIKDAVSKIYDAVVVIESYRNGKLIGSGSGFVYKKENKLGYVITNHHVIESATEIKVVNMNGQSVDATLLGSDEYADIAVLSISEEAVLAVSEIGDSTKLELGDTLFTVGTPVGSAYMGSVTKGILSGKNRTVSVNLSNGNYVMEVVQTDAAINPGNSGGPLVNINGEVIGVNSLKLVEDEIEGMGFAIPIELVMSSVDHLEKGEQIQRPILGVSILDVSNTYALYMNRITLPENVDSGVVIANLEKDYPAEKAGLKTGDVIVEINGTKIEDTANFRYNLYKYNIGDTVEVKYYRDGKENKTSVLLEKSME